MGLVERLLIICSDNHNIKKYVLKENCWIKADCTFEGLKQVVFEPMDRVRIQSLKPHEKAEYQVIDSINISHSDFHSQRLGLNQNLNSIIGGRSTGKSVLLGAIAKKLNSDKEVKFGNEEYTAFVNEVVSSISVTWKDGVINNNRNIEYFPQSYMYRLAKNKRNELDRLIEGIINQDPEKKELISNYETFSNENSIDITNKIGRLFQLQDELIRHSSLLKEKGDEEGINKEIEKLGNELLELKKKIHISDENLEKYNKFKIELNLLNKSTENISAQISKITSLKSKFFTNTDIEYELISLDDINTNKIRQTLGELKERFQKAWDSELDTLLSFNSDKILENSKNIERIEKEDAYIYPKRFRFRC